MRIRLTLRREPAEAKDLAVTVDGLATVADIAVQLWAADPDRKGTQPPEGLSLRIDEAFVAGGMRGLVLDRSDNLLESGLRPGSVVSLTQVSEQFSVPGASRGPAAATLRVLSGPDVGQEFSLPSGTSYIGRDPDVDIRLSDPMTSKRHARITVGETVEIVDTNSANGLLMDGLPVTRATLNSSDTVTLGDTTVTVVALSRNQAAAPTSPLVDFNRSPRVVPRFDPVKKVLPAGPKRPDHHPFPYIMLVAPLLMGAVIFAITRNVLSVVFMGMMPLFIIGHYVDHKMQTKREHKEQVKHFRESMTAFREDITELQRVERAVRLQEAPSVEDTVDSIYKLGPLLWTHRPEHSGFLGLRFGLGTSPSRITFEQGNNDTEVEYTREIQACIRQFQDIEGVPIVSQLRSAGSFGLAGSRGLVDDVARGMVLQMVGLHSPAEVAVTAITSAQSRERWDWLQWLPHVGSGHSPLAGDHLAAGSAGGSSLLARLEDLVESREAGAKDARPVPRPAIGQQSLPDPGPVLPVVLVIVEDDAPVDRGRLTRLVERGPDSGVHVMWVAADIQSLPAACRDFMAVDGDHGTTTGQVRLGRHTYPVSCESVDAELAGQLARMLAPVVDVGKPLSDDSDLPRAVSYATLIGKDFMDNPQAVADRWKENNSVHAFAVPNRKDNGTLRALVGSKGVEPLYLDLKNEGPHALVGGTTGAGKSEFLQSWVMGMAAAYSPDRVSFLFVDYKGGAAFADCLHLPHTVGLVTDLSPHLVRRALTSLRAELHYREHLLNRKKAKDLLGLQREADPEAPPYLIIIVDEFAALATEVPEFVDGVVDVAARGRSLGLHLILATQRPAGVIKESLRANTNLRVALRMADEDDATDILGVPDAAYFDPSIPGRGAAKTGPGRIQGFQTGYAGGWTTEKPQRPQIDIVEMAFGSGPAWEEPAPDKPVKEEPAGPNDISRMTSNIVRAAEVLAIEPPRKPWLNELATAYDFSKLPNPRTDERLLLGVADDPAHQDQPTVFYEPDKDGNMAIYGTGGSGKSAALRGIAIAAAVTPRGGPVHVYGIDCGSSGLKMLDGLPHVGEIINGDDVERVGRLLRWLRDVADDRSARFAEVRASTIVEYRKLANMPDEKRIFILVDGMSAFREAYEYSRLSALWDIFLQLATDGRPLGIHLVVSGDRTNSVPASLLASIQRRLVLRLSSEDDYISMDVPKDVLSPASPPGRGMLGGYEVQLAVLGGNSNLALQAREVNKLSEAMHRQGVEPAPKIQRLPEQVDLDILPTGSTDLPVIGVDDETLQPAEIMAKGPLLVAGPPGAGRTVALVTMAYALRRSNPAAELVYIGSRRSAVASLRIWNRSIVGAEDLEAVAEELMEHSVANPRQLAFFIEGLTEFTDTEAESGLEQLISASIKADQWVIGESETSTWSSAWSLAQPFKSGRRGLLINPGDIEGDALLNTSLGRISTDFIPGRGYIVGRGKVRKLQIALPPENRG
ncbi:FtsK/SpoIIIE domain-containing protein [Pseudarthrobacter sp. J75]|uniref:FtsK/SpoIIIE domain-containing protein n=1 Tax=unclassified Pseudarthrobacter TaxID=2647000 RepID=UPI002E81DCC2|nr:MULTISPECIES: FtsK/SpoIIIE domain-containing protein [unclassified Pseudarthrobacter]MEE2521708.1 FtsK/SpoIIIE domain-containing protein [Pseudarthrobacter sp. J47]MEE2527785.1 FtsK/SpoIIIE domain-containing protein [Pseudarthrobacter sp. J75]MEE2569353.1 FtsK/SpoIIIE domain-containing protein [Pseudarthrobacter sp. J64]